MPRQTQIHRSHTHRSQETVDQSGYEQDYRRQELAKRIELHDTQVELVLDAIDELLETTPAAA